MKVVLKNLTKKFPTGNRKRREEFVAVDHLNFEIPDGKLVGLLGPSGCGKSTTLNMICGLENPTEASWNIVRWLVKHGYSEEDIGKVIGGNAIRVLREVWAN